MVMHEIIDTAPKKGLGDIKIEPLFTKPGYKPAKQYYRLSYKPNLFRGWQGFSVLTKADVLNLVDYLLLTIADE